MNKEKKRIVFLTRGAVVAALYTALTLLFAPISFGIVQFRISEVLTVLPAFTPSAIPGLFIGCLISNIYSGSVFDIVFGSLATLFASYFSYLLRKRKYLVPLPPVVINSIVIPLIIKYAYKADQAIPLIALSVFLGEILSCYLLGIPLMILLEKYRNKLFKE